MSGTVVSKVSKLQLMRTFRDGYQCISTSSLDVIEASIDTVLSL